MADMMRDAMTWLAGKMQAHVSQPVTISRGDLNVAALATLGKTLLKLDDGYGNTRMEWTDRDYLIPAASYVLGGVVVEPARGDQIRETQGGITYVFEVLPYGMEPVWCWADEHRTMLRIHAKEVGRE